MYKVLCIGVPLNQLLPAGLPGRLDEEGEGDG